jgi:hypothetical protein
VKNVLIVVACSVAFLSMTYEGTWHDKRIAEVEEYELPADSTLVQDKGFQGFAVDGVIILQPKKKPRGGELTEDEKEQNRRINRIRVQIEHVIGGVKRCRIVKDTCRLWREGVRDMVMETCCGLHNLRITYRPWSYELCNES